MPAINAFMGGKALSTVPTDFAFDITPSDAEELPYITRALYVGGGGDVHVLTAGGDEVTYRNLGSGSLKPGGIRKVFATGTTATFLIGEY